MSHFTVLVAANDEQDLADKLQPYHEYECTGILDEYVVWVPANLEEAKTEMEQVNERYTKSDTEKYPSLEAFLAGWYGYRQNEEGEWGRLTNPRKKWDWWSVGGRWSGLLKLKPGRVGSNGEGGFMNDANADPGHADIARVEDVDWDWMRQRNIDAARKLWHDWRVYQKIVAEVKLETDDEKEQRQRVFARTRDLDEFHYMMMRQDELEAIEGLSEEEYVEKHGQMSALTFAFIDQSGEWHERAHMGWWGMTRDSVNSYDEQFWQFIGSLGPKQPLYLVDAHI